MSRRVSLAVSLISVSEIISREISFSSALSANIRSAISLDLVNVVGVFVESFFRQSGAAEHSGNIEQFAH